MQALLFEMTPRAGHEEHYFAHADRLRPHLATQEGLIFINRFKSVSRSGVILSHSLWRDEASIARWRTHAQHNQSQVAGRNQHFEDYRIRIAHVLEHASKGEAVKKWSAEGAYRATGSGATRLLAILTTRNEAYDEQGEAFQSVNSDDAYISVIGLESASAGRAIMTAAKQAPIVETALLCAVSRDYGMFDRTEAPQYYAPV